MSKVDIAIATPYDSTKNVTCTQLRPCKGRGRARAGEAELEREGAGSGWLSVSIELRPFVTPFHSVPPLKPSHDRNSPTDATSVLPTFKAKSTFHLPPWELELLPPSLPAPSPPLPFSPLHCLRSISRHQRRSVAKLRLQSARPACTHQTS